MSTTDPTSNVLVDIKNGIGHLTLDRVTKHNSLTNQMLQDMRDALASWASDPSVRVVVLGANGPTAFSTGADLHEMVNADPDTVRASNMRWIELFELIETMPQPVIASVHGYCIAGGTELTLSCDLIIAADDARFGLTEINVGVVPGAGACVRLPRWLTPAIAKEVLMLGEMIPADEALRLGLVNRVVPAADLADATESLALDLARRAPAALALAKRAVNVAADLDLRTGIQTVLDQFVQLFGTADQIEGMSAFLEKRPPVFTGR
jgi:enoyl-CoA hydratase/carnithine racemase